MRLVLIIIIGFFPLIAWTQPTITNFSPSSAAEGSTVIISGSEFSETPEDNTVTFDGITATVTAATLTSLTTTVPAGLTAGPITIEVTVGGQTASSGFIVLPTLTNFTPLSGVEGTLVTINGTGFSITPSDNEVTINGVAAIVTASTSTSITTSVPDDVTAGSGPITVTVGGQLVTSVSNFTVLPAIASFTPTSGVVGTSVTITGTGFSSTPSSNSVIINGEVATVTAASTTSITTSVPAGATAGIGSITVTVGGQLATSGSSFTIAPTIASFTPTSGVVGTSVTITGTGFSSTPASNGVTINGMPATVTASSATSIITSVPAGATAGNGTITVTVGGQLATSVSNFTVSPTITGFTPTSAATGASITLTGTGFSTIPANNNVRFFNNIPATVTAATTTSLTVTVPTNASAGAISVTVGGQTAISSGSFTPLAPPTITSLNPNSGAIGGSIAIIGTNFSATASDNVVQFNGSPAVVNNSNPNNKRLTVTVPAGATSGPVTLTLNGVTVSSPSNFTILPTPSITSFSPTSGAPGATVTITGENFTTITAITFNGISALADIVSSTATSITVKVPSGAASGPISVTTSAVTVTSTSNFTVLTSPTISGFTPGTGAEGATVTITGTNFSTTPSENSVSFNGTPAIVSFSTSTTITTTVPAGASTGLISVTVSGVTIASASNFTILPTPEITGFSPTSGAIGATVIITGAHFSPSPAVSFNGIASNVTTSNTNSITVLVPDNAVTGPISVTTSGITITSTSNFTVLPSPLISAFSPTTGAIGATVIISGSNFSNTPGDHIVKFNNTTAVVSASTSNSITAIVPGGATTGKISVNVNGVTTVSADDFVVLPTPIITGFNPTSGAVGATIVIEGNNFNTTPSNNTVRFNGVTAIVSSSSVSSITTSVPVGAGTGTLSVTVNSVTVNSGSNFTVLPSPTISSLSPENGAVGATVTISGTNFSSSPSVSFNGTPAVVIAYTATTITTTVPVGATSGTIDVTTSGVTITSATNFTVLPSPTITGFSPGNGAVGASVIISGTNFSSTPADHLVKFNNTPAVVIASTATTITATVPAGATSGKISVTVSGVTVFSSTNFSVLSTPTINEFTPSSGSVGAIVTITGTNFNTTPSLLFNGTPAIASAFNTGSISTTVPAGASTGPISILVNGVSISSSSNFTVLPSPVITGFTPTKGAVGTVVSVSGSNFITSPSISFNGTLATITSSTSSSIETSVPSGAATGPVSLLVNGVAVTSGDSFTVLPTPTLSNFSPVNGAIGATVTISGTNFDSSPNVFFNGVAAIVTSSTANSITTVVPAGATNGKISVMTSGLTIVSANNFTVLPTPTIASFSPTSGAIGATVIITGTNFNLTPSNNSVTFNGVSTIVSAATATTITTSVPAGTSTGPIAVTVSGVTITSSGNFTVFGSPTISGFSPGSGAVGASVIISGTNFSTVPTDHVVKFNNTTAVVTASTATSITTTVPAGATSGKISVAVSGVTVLSSNNFVVSPTPTVTGFSPTGGITGTIVTITGTNFDSPIVTFNNIPAVVNSSNSTSITTAVPAGAGTGPISITSSSITINSASNFTVFGTPSISGFSPSSGVYGVSVTISGTNFSSTAANNAVRFNGVLATVLSSTTTSITTTVPVGATTGPISVTVNGITGNSATNFTVPTPVISSFNPTSGAVGTSVTVAGTNFSATPTNNLVEFNGITSVVTSSTSSSLVTVVPSGASTGAISVTVGGVGGTSASNFTVLPTPSISSFSPIDGAIGAVVIINGANFSSTPSDHLVKFNNTTAVVTASTATSITTLVPAGATTGKISISVSGVTIVSADNFSVFPTPTVTGFSPANGAAGASVIISGTNFSTTPSDHVVKFNNTIATVTASSLTSITATVPVGATSGPITITLRGITVTSPSNFTVIPSPSITGFNPTSGAVGASVIISGTNFSNTSSDHVVKFNNTTAVVTTSTTTSITTTVPVGASTGTISVTVNGATVASSSNFTVLATPTITSFSPLSGAVDATITIIGTDFSPTPANNIVTFNGVVANITSATATSITAKVPAGATTGKIALTLNGVTVQSISDFTIAPSPTITGFNLSSGAPGASVVISGTNFSATPANNVVTFSGVPANVTVSSANTLTTMVPAGATTGPITVTVNGVTVISTSNFIVLGSPSISAITPNRGAVGAPVTISGINFSNTAGNHTVKFNNTIAVVTTSTTTSVSTIVPNGATTGKISITVSGVTIESGSDFTVLPLPTISGFSPNQGAPGATVTISGTNFNTTPGENMVYFNGTAAFVSAATNTNLTITVPNNAVTGPIAVNTSGVTITSINNFEVLPVPSIIDINPEKGAESATVIITGTNFNSTPTNNVITFNGSVASVTASTSTSITTAVPSGATTGKISLTLNGITVSSQKEFTVMPTHIITDMSPISAAVGATVSITGLNFSTTPSDQIIKFNGVIAQISASTATSITTKVPAGASTGRISITLNGITAISAADFTIVPAPSITNVSPSSGTAGTEVKITGLNFSSEESNNMVTFNGTPATVDASSATVITTTVPNGATSGPISVTVNGATVLSLAPFNVLLTPTITSFSPASGIIGKTIIIDGINFSEIPSENTVKFNGTAAIVTASTTTSITTTVPANASSGPISVSVNGITGISSGDFTVILDETPPTLSLNKTATEVTSGSSLLITAQFLDPESGVASASVTFQSITNRTEPITASLIKAGDDWEFSIPFVLIGELGVEYKLHATNGKGLVYTSPSYTLVKVRVADNGLSIPYTSYGSSIANYAIISVPLKLDKPSVQNVLDELPAYDKTKWRISHYDNITNSNKELAPSEEIRPGIGYWLLIKDNPGVSLTTGPGSTVDASSPFTLQLKAGWNQIGNPYNFNILWNDLVAANPGLPLSFRGFNGSIKNFENKTTLNRMEGGFVNVPADMELIYPVKKNSNGRIEFSEGKLENSIDQTDWDLDFIITQGDISNVIGGIGMRQQASEDFDIYDGFSMPRFDEFLEINHNKKLNRYNYSKDVIATTDYHTWQFKVEASNTDKPASIQWDNRYLGNNDLHLILYDEQSKVWMNMKEHHAYSFTPPSNFKVIYGSELDVSKEIGLGNAKLIEVSPNPSQGPINIHLFLPDWQTKFRVQIDLKSLTGVTVANIYSGELMSGYQEIKWSGENGLDKLPGGVYIVQLKCNNAIQTSRLILLD